MSNQADSPAFHFVKCPVLQEKISHDDCFTFIMCVDGLGPQPVMDALLADHPDFEKRCLECPCHAREFA